MDLQPENGIHIPTELVCTVYNSKEGEITLQCYTCQTKLTLPSGTQTHCFHATTQTLRQDILVSIHLYMANIVHLGYTPYLGVPYNRRIH